MVSFTTENPKILPNGLVSITFSATDGVYIFTDAIVITAEQHAQALPGHIETEERRRWDDWLAIITPVEEPEDG